MGRPRPAKISILAQFLLKLSLSHLRQPGNMKTPTSPSTSRSIISAGLKLVPTNFDMKSKSINTKCREIIDFDNYLSLPASTSQHQAHLTTPDAPRGKVLKQSFQNGKSFASSRSREKFWCGSSSSRRGWKEESFVMQERRVGTRPGTGTRTLPGTTSCPLPTDTFWLSVTNIWIFGNILNIYFTTFP